jgi:hypothetical protein
LNFFTSFSFQLSSGSRYLEKAQFEIKASGQVQTLLCALPSVEGEYMEEL